MNWTLLTVKRTYVRVSGSSGASIAWDCPDYTITVWSYNKNVGEKPCPERMKLTAKKPPKEYVGGLLRVEIDGRRATLAEFDECLAEIELPDGVGITRDSILGAVNATERE